MPLTTYSLTERNRTGDDERKLDLRCKVNMSEICLLEMWFLVHRERLSQADNGALFCTEPSSPLPKTKTHVMRREEIVKKSFKAANNIESNVSKKPQIL